LNIDHSEKFDDHLIKTLRMGHKSWTMQSLVIYII